MALDQSVCNEMGRVVKGGLITFPLDDAHLTAQAAGTPSRLRGLPASASAPDF